VRSLFDEPIDFVVHRATATDAAYNGRMGTDLYRLGVGRTNAVSFDRPEELARGAGRLLWHEYPMLRWLEREGFSLAYISSADLHQSASPLFKAHGFLSIGHDEYWDRRQYDSAIASVQAGVNHLYLSGNSVFGLTPYQPSQDGRPNRVLSREGVYGGVYGNLNEFFQYPFPQEGPPANRLMGAHTVYPFNGGGDWIVTQPDHWVFAGTGVKKGDAIPGLVGWEFHGDPAKIDGLEILAEGDALQGGVRPSHWTATIYPGPKKNFVFNASTIFWTQGLSSPPGHMLPWSHWTRPHGPDPRVQRITRNLIARALAR
jgi:hypothetical protein